MPRLILLGGEDVSARIEISRKFMEAGYDVEIIGTEKEARFVQNNIPYTKYALNRELNLFSDIRTVFAFRGILKKQEQGTIVHAFDTKPTMFLPLSAVGLRNISIVRTITGMGRIFTEESVKNRVLRYLYNCIQKAVGRRVDFTIFQNDDDYAYYMKYGLVPVEKTAVIKSSGLDLEKFDTQIDSDVIEKLKKELSLDEGQKTFILVSRMVKQKGILNYLEAARMCRENGYRFNFLLVGQLDSDRSVTQEQIDAYAQYVNYLGRREDVKALLALSDIFVLPTYYREGVPRVLLEASAMGLGLIATDMPGCRDVVIDEYNGKLVKVKDSKDLYEKMVYMATDDKRLNVFSINSTEYVKNFSLERVARRYNEIYQHLGSK